jgi:hypothetical protein
VVIYMLIYADDIIITGSCKKAVFTSHLQ